MPYARPALARAVRIANDCGISALVATKEYYSGERMNGVLRDM